MHEVLRQVKSGTARVGGPTATEELSRAGHPNQGR